RAQIARDRLRLSPLLRVGPGECALRVDHADDRPPEAFREPKQAQRLAIAFRLRHAGIAADLLVGRSAALMTKQHEGMVREPSETTDYGGIVGEGSVAMQLREVAKQLSGVVQSLRPVGMTRQLHAIPGAQILVDFGLEPAPALLQRLELDRSRFSRAELLDAP